MNYDPNANTDDGSCSYCAGTMLTLTMNDSWGDGWNGNTWTATGTATGTVYGPYTVASGTQAIEMVCMDDDDYYPPERISHAVETLTNSTAL